MHDIEVYFCQQSEFGDSADSSNLEAYFSIKSAKKIWSLLGGEKQIWIDPTAQYLLRWSGQLRNSVQIWKTEISWPIQ